MMEKQTWLIIGASSDVGVSYIRHLADKGTDGLTIYAHCNNRVSRFRSAVIRRRERHLWKFAI